MSEMVERVARAMCEADGRKPDVVLAINRSHRMEPVDGCARPEWHAYLPAARAAIEAMREPTEAMIRAASKDICDAPPIRKNVTAGEMAASVWRDMLDAALP